VVDRHKSDIRHQRKSKELRLANRMVKKRISTQYKKILSAVESNDLAQSEEHLKKYFSLIDTAGRKGIVHKKTAARKKSRLTKKVALLKNKAAHA